MKRVTAGIGVAAISMSCAFAQEESVDDGLYVRIGVGATFVEDLEQDYTFNPNFVSISAWPTGQRVENSEAATFAGAIGFDYADGIRTELEYRYASTEIDGVFQQDPVVGDVPVTPAEGDLKAHLLMANFYFDFDNDTPLTPFVGGGVGGAFVSNENGDSDAALAYQGRAGVSYDFDSGVSTSVEYVYTRSRDLVFGPNDDDFTPTGPLGPRIDGDNYIASSVMLSVRMKF